MLSPAEAQPKSSSGLAQAWPGLPDFVMHKSKRKSRSPNQHWFYPECRQGLNSPEREIPGPISCNFPHGPRNPTMLTVLSIFLGGLMGPIHPVWGHAMVCRPFVSPGNLPLLEKTFSMAKAQQHICCAQGPNTKIPYANKKPVPNISSASSRTLIFRKSFIFLMSTFSVCSCAFDALHTDDAGYKCHKTMLQSSVCPSRVESSKSCIFARKG